VVVMLELIITADDWISELLNSIENNSRHKYTQFHINVHLSKP
jgi:hypothetical protein